MKWGWALLCLSAACVEAYDSPTHGVPSSLELRMITPSPNQLGTPTHPVDPSPVTYDVTMVDDQGAIIDADFDVQVYISSGGMKSGLEMGCGAVGAPVLPIETLHLVGGRLLNHTTTLPQAYGPTNVWLEEETSHAGGASPTLYYRNPYISDIQTPPDVNAANAAYCNPYDRRFVTVDSTATGGHLVVTSVFNNAFTVTDTASGAFGDFNSLYVFSFSQPPRAAVPGRVLKSINGNLSKFIGFMELNFPSYKFDYDTPLQPLPPPLVITAGDTSNLPKLLGASAGVVTVTGTECDPNPPNPNHNPTVQNVIDQWSKFNAFIIDGDRTCSSFTNYAVQLPQKSFGGFDATANVGKTLTVTGMLRNNSGRNPVLDSEGNPVACNDSLPCGSGTCLGGVCMKGAFNFWSIVVRTPADIQVQ